MITAPARARTPEETWELVEPRLRDHGISRVADLTGLDTVGMPVAMAVRPLATTVGASQGKGPTPLAARLSAVMEALEVGAAERFRPAAPVVAPAAELDLPYPVTALGDTERSVLTARFPLAWVEGHDLRDGAATPVPLLAVQMDGIADGHWRPRSLYCSTNGLASGNDLDEATVQGLLEACERDAVAGLAATPADRRRVLDLATLPPCWARELTERLHAARFWVEAVRCPALPGLTAFATYVWSPDMPGVYAGSGAHPVPAVALERALSEAVQSRMSVISGVREDLGPVAYAGVRRPRPPAPVAPDHGWDDVTAEVAAAAVPLPGERIGDLVGGLTALVGAASGLPVLRVDLTPPGEPVAVAKVLAPGLCFDVYRQLARPETEGTP